MLHIMIHFSWVVLFPFSLQKRGRVSILMSKVRFIHILHAILLLLTLTLFSILVFNSVIKFLNCGVILKSLIMTSSSPFVVVIFESSVFIVFFTNGIIDGENFLFFMTLKSSGFEISVNFNFLPLEDWVSVNFREVVVVPVLI